MCDVCVAVQSGRFVEPLNESSDPIVAHRQVRRANDQLRYYLQHGEERLLARMLMAVRWRYPDHWQCPYCRDLMIAGFKFLESKGWINCDWCRRSWTSWDFIASPTRALFRPSRKAWNRSCGSDRRRTMRAQFELFCAENHQQFA